jgi:DtxR family transcriptional regulator, Mn-dependent transcriptional regulator
MDLEWFALLAGFLVALLLVALVFWPRRGLLGRWQDYRAAQRREELEDALKYLLEREQGGSHASLDSLAGALQLTRTQNLALATRLQAQGLVTTLEDAFHLHLTADGERWAMQVVRAHRLWERYLADEARMPLKRIHSQAHRREHALTTAQVDELDAQLGHPTRDPHGDPIPDAQGRLPETDGKPLSGGVALTAWPADQPGRIVHLEDEPPLAYAQILSEGLRLGQTLRVLESTPQRITLSDGEGEYRLAPVVARNVYLEPLPVEIHQQPGVLSLADLAPSQPAEIIALDEACQGFTRRRFLDLGLTPGTRIHPELQNAFGDPRGYRVRGTLIALRREQAGQVWVRPL